MRNRFTNVGMGSITIAPVIASLTAVISLAAVGVAVSPSVAFAQNLHFVDLQAGSTAPAGSGNPADTTPYRRIKLQWDTRPSNPAGSAPSGAPAAGDPTTVSAGVDWTQLVRNGSGVFSITTETAFNDIYWDYDTTYTYHLAGTAYYYSWSADSGGTYSWHGGSMPWTSSDITITVRKVLASGMQTVDTRIDPRLSTYVTKDYKFSNNTYRGGLFAGYNADGANVARTYLKFTSLAGPVNSTDKLWGMGGLGVYRTRLTKAGQTTSLECRGVSDDSWTPSTMVWSTAPSYQATGASPVSISWDASTDPGRWFTFPVLPEIETNLTGNGGDGTLSLAILSPTESNGGTSATFPLVASSPGWAYFARDNYTEGGVGGFTPYLIYAYGGQGAGLTGIGVSPTSIQGGHTVTGTVSLGYPAPSGATISLSSGSTSVTVPATVTIPTGSSTATFTVTTSTVTTSTTVTLTAQMSGVTKTTNLTVTP